MCKVLLERGSPPFYLSTSAFPLSSRGLRHQQIINAPDPRTRDGPYGRTVVVSVVTDLGLPIHIVCPMTTVDAVVVGELEPPLVPESQGPWLMV